MLNENNDIRSMIERFNPAQKDATTSTLGPMLIIAGAGSGKTSVLTARIALLMSQGVPPQRILALTFTKKAAEEMRSRIIAMQGEDARRITMGTFHSVFIQFLRPFAERLGFPQNFTILDEDDSMSCLKRCIEQVVAPQRPPKDQWTEEMKKLFEEQDRAYKPKTVMEAISWAKNNLITVQAYANDPKIQSANAAAKRPLLWKIYEVYADTCRRMGMMDFDDILLYTDILLARYPDAMAIIAGGFDYFLVDEYQDTNYAQYSILKRLTWINKNICVVGDDSQSIYAFRGARIQNILNFKDEYPGCRLVRLEQNYRSTRNIVTVANRLIEKNSERIPKECFTDKDGGEPIKTKTTNTEKDEAWFIANTIRDDIRNRDGANYGDFAVLYRTNAQSRAIEDAFVKARIPYTVYSGTSFYSRMEIKDLLAYFRLAVNPHDDEAFLRVLNKPARGVGDTGKKALIDIARSWNCSLWSAVTNPQLMFCNLPARLTAGVDAFVADIRKATQYAETMGAYQAAVEICEMTGFYESYNAENDEESRARAENLRELIDAAKAFEEECATEVNADGTPVAATLPAFLENTMLLSNADTGGNADGKVSLMTVHCAKGLEFDTVFVAGMETNLFPLNIDGSQFELEEERRLFYVAMTRAERELYLTRAISRMRFGKRTENKPSVFLSELR